MSEPRQKICIQLGASGCYLLAIVYWAERILKERVDVVDLYEAALETDVIQPDCFVNDPGKLMQMMVPGQWEMHKETMAYRAKADEYEITRYERPTTAGILSHFVCTDYLGNVIYDPLGESQCAKLGKPVSKRVFRKVG